MKLEDQVCSLDLAKRLKKLGVKPWSMFYWNTKLGKIAWSGDIQLAPVDFGNRCISAFTVAELGEMLPMHHNYGAPQSGKCNDGHEYVADYIHWGNLWHDRKEFDWGFRRRRTLIPKGSRTAFRAEAEHHRSVATLAS